MTTSLLEMVENLDIEAILMQLNIPYDKDEEGEIIETDDTILITQYLSNAYPYIINQLDFAAPIDYYNYIQDNHEHIDMIAGQACIMLIAEWYNNRDGNVYTNYNEIPNSVKQLLRSIRIYDNCGI